MGLLKLDQKRSDGIEFIDVRDKLYYNKYNYRARFHCPGLQLIWWCKSESEIRARVTQERYKRNAPYVEHMIKFYNFIKANADKKNKKCTVRVESDVAAIFSNDLNLLKTLESIGMPVDFTEVQVNLVPEGVKYYTKEPDHKYRLYLKSKRVPDGWANKLRDWINKYQGTSTVITPSRALKDWYDMSDTITVRSGVRSSLSSTHQNWKKMWSSSHYYIDYNDESTLTLFMLVFDGMVYKRFQLLKKPD